MSLGQAHPADSHLSPTVLLLEHLYDVPLLHLQLLRGVIPSQAPPVPQEPQAGQLQVGLAAELLHGGPQASVDVGGEGEVVPRRLHELQLERRSVLPELVDLPSRLTNPLVTNPPSQKM